MFSLDISRNLKHTEMKKLFFGIAIGVAAVYVIKKVYNEDKFGKLRSNVDRCSSKAKKRAKDILDHGVNQAEYLGERAQQEYERGKGKLNKAIKG